MNWKGYILSKAFSLLVMTLDEESLRKLADMVLDVVEDFIDGIESDIKPELIEICDNIRGTFNIPDKDE